MCALNCSHSDKYKEIGERINELETIMNEIGRCENISTSEDKSKYYDLVVPRLFGIVNDLNIENIRLKQNMHIRENELDKMSEKINTSEDKLHFLNIDFDHRLKNLSESIEEVKSYKDLQYLISRIHPEAVEELKNKKSSLYRCFFSKAEHEMAIMAIDIRRSTELMLKSVSPVKYSDFITNLTENIKEVIISNYGVFDKFTGDGLLAYFPVYYSGEQAILCCINAAIESHKVFNDNYRKHRDVFNVVIKTGLGIGVDYGFATITRINNEPTIVGSPVVYACRLSSAISGHTYLNQGAMKIMHKNGKKSELEEIEFDLKNEGKAIVYDLISNEKNLVNHPIWKKI